MYKVFPDTKGNLGGPEYEQNYSTIFLQKKKNVLVSPLVYKGAEQKTGEMVMDDGVPII